MAKKLAKLYAYLGVFLGYDEDMNPIHVTLEYFPNSTSDEYIKEVLRTAPIGKNVTIKAIKKGSWNGENFGYLVELPEELKPYFKNRIHNLPHITTKIQHGGKAVNTWKAFTGEGKSAPCCEIFEGTVTMFYRSGAHFQVG